MPVDTKLNSFVINELTTEQYNELLENGQISETEFYLTTDNHYPTEQEMNLALAGKQDKLVSGTNIKTVNNNSLLGSGNIEISTITVDDNLSLTSENPVQNKAITAVISDLSSQVNIDSYLDLIIEGNTESLPIVLKGPYETDLTEIIGETYVNV